MNKVVNMASGFDIADILPSLKILHIISGMKPKLNHLFHKVDKILETIIRKHLEHRAAFKDRNKDLLDILLRVQEQGELDFPITNENIKAVMVEIFGAGTDTSSSTTEWAMSEMLKNPRVMEKAQAEVRRVMNRKGKIDEIIKETLRMHPSAPLLLPRLNRERCEIDRYEIPIGTKVIINAWALGRNSGQWHNPDTFEPERFDSIPIDYKGTNFEYIPLGAGRRMCPGIVFGIANVELLLAQVLYHFDWQLPNGVKPKDLDMIEQFGAVVKRKNDLYLTPVPYTISC
ncbi:hypothetical protein MKX03_013077 [Papaver bracteatum]|nr:hypothetical protein MKX03_013077 [Papaver bracteatum]